MVLLNKKISVMWTLLYIFLVFPSITNGQFWSTYYFPSWLRLRELNDNECPEPTGQFSHPKYCDFWLNCWEGRAIVGRCQHDLVFNEKIRACDYKHNVDCSGKVNSLDGSPPLDPRCPKYSGTFVNPADCSEYFVCQAGIANVYKCPDGTFYNTDLGVCDYRPGEGCQLVEEETSNPPINQKPQRPPLQEKPNEIEENPNPSPPIEIQGSSSENPKPVTSVNEKPQQPPINENPPAQVEEKPQAPSIGEKPPSQIEEKPQPPQMISNSTPVPTSEIPDEDFSPSRPVAAGTPTLSPTTHPQTPSVRPKPQPIPSPSPSPVENTMSESSITESETSSTPAAISNLKPKPPLKPETEEEEGPPAVDVSNVKPKPPFQPPNSKPNPSERPTQIPPTLNPELFKPQRPPNAPSGKPVTTPDPVDGEDDPNILFPFLPKFPDLFRCPLATGIFPVIGDCGSVITCVSGKPHRLRCPKGEHYDVVRGHCDTEKNFICSKTTNNLIAIGDNNGLDVSLISPDDVIYAYLPVSMFNKLLKVEMMQVRSQESPRFKKR